MHSEGTYLAWVDISQTGMSADSLAQEIMERAHVKVNSGTLYGSISGEGYLRINLACPRSLLKRRCAESASISDKTIPTTYASPRKEETLTKARRCPRILFNI